MAGFDSGLDFSAPAVKMVPRPDAPGGIPEVEIFALRVPGVGLLGVAAAGAFFGLKGLLSAAILGEEGSQTGSLQKTCCSATGSPFATDAQVETV